MDLSDRASLLRAAVEGTPEFTSALLSLEQRGQRDEATVQPEVAEIVGAVRRDGDRALGHYVHKFEGRRPEQWLVRNYGGPEALAKLPESIQVALQHAADRIRRYHERQARHLGAFEYEEEGVTLASRVSPLERVGVYAPGGKARYPSSVLMAAIPAQVAGVREVLVACPDITPEVRAACHLAGVSGVLDAGGAQAIAALAYGTESVPRVDKIVGPGNIYVATAKRLVFGAVDIDGIAGPSEILVLADETANPRVVAADLLSQAEHDEAAYALLVTTQPELLELTRAELARQLDSLPRRGIAEASLRERGYAFVVEGRAALAEIANRLAPEHVALHLRDARRFSAQIQRVGAVFVGADTPEAAGDYLAGPSHVLPTGGAARFGAPLGVYDFVTRSSLIQYEPEALAAQAADICSLARAEGLEAHARAVEVRTSRAR